MKFEDQPLELFEVLTDYPEVFKILQKISNDFQKGKSINSDDVLQSVLEKVIEKPITFVNKKHCINYIKMMIRNKYVEISKKREKHSFISIDDIEEDLFTEDFKFPRSDIDLSSLTVHERHLIRRVYVSNMSFRELSERLHISQNAVRERHKNALKKLKKVIKQEGELVYEN